MRTDCGYDDQSYLTHDVVGLADLAPGEWLAAVDLEPDHALLSSR